MCENFEEKWEVWEKSDRSVRKRKMHDKKGETWEKVRYVKKLRNVRKSEMCEKKWEKLEKKWDVWGKIWRCVR